MVLNFFLLMFIFHFAATLQSNIRKFQDPSKVIYDDSLKRKHNIVNGTPWALNGLTIPNGHANGIGTMSNGQAVHYANGGERVNLNVNPMSELERAGMIANAMQADSPRDKVRRASISRMLYTYCKIGGRPRFSGYLGS